MDEEKAKQQNDKIIQENTKNELDKYLNQAPQENETLSSIIPKIEVTQTNVSRPSSAINNTDGTNPAKSNETLKNPEGSNIEKPKIKPIIRTYKSDMEETIRSQHVSSLNIAVAENNRMVRRLTEESSVEEKKADKNYKIFIIILVLIFAGILVFVIPFFLVREQLEPEEIELPVESLILADTSERVNIDTLNKDRISRTLGERVDQVSILLGSIRQFNLTEGEGALANVITAKRFLELVKARVPDGLSRTLRDQFMFGIHGIKGNQTFLILKVGSYETTYAGMLLWESGLWYDFSELFGLDRSNSTDSLGRPILGEEVRRFQDVVVKNKDTRAIKDEEGGIIFLYSVVDKNTVVLSTSADTFKEIMNRMDKMSVTR